MASQRQSQSISQQASSQANSLSQQAGEAMGQAQVKKDGMMDRARDGLDKITSDETVNTYTASATNFLQQTGEQVKNMAQGAADAVKNTLGMNNDRPTTAATGNANTIGGGIAPSGGPGSTGNIATNTASTTTITSNQPYNHTNRKI